MATFEDQWKQWMAEGRKRFEEMQVQFSLGKMDAADAFEKQKDFLRGAVSNWKQELDKATDVAEEHAQKLKASLEELQVQLNLGKAEGREKFEEQRKKIDLAMQEVYAAGKKAYHNNYDNMMHLFDSNAQAFKTGIEIIQLQFALVKMDVKEDAEKLRKELNEKMHELSEKYNEVQKAAVKNIEEWNKHLKEGYDKMSHWVSDFLKHHK